MRSLLYFTATCPQSNETTAVVWRIGGPRVCVKSRFHDPRTWVQEIVKLNELPCRCVPGSSTFFLQDYTVRGAILRNIAAFRS